MGLQGRKGSQRPEPQACLVRLYTHTSSNRNLRDDGRGQTAGLGSSFSSVISKTSSRHGGVLTRWRGVGGQLQRYSGFGFVTFRQSKGEATARHDTTTRHNLPMRTMPLRARQTNYLQAIKSWEPPTPTNKTAIHQRTRGYLGRGGCAPVLDSSLKLRQALVVLCGQH